MSTEIVPIENAPEEPQHEHGPDGQQRRDGGPSHGRSGRRRRKPFIPSRDECLWQLAEIRGLVAMKLLTPAEANAIVRAIQVQLAESRSSQASGSAHSPSDDLIRRLRAEPEMIEHLESLLTDAQIQSLMKGVMDDDQSET